MPRVTISEGRRERMANTKSGSRRSRTGKKADSKKEMRPKHQIEVLRKRIVTLEGRLRVLEDIEEIKKLQRIYGYYVDNKLWDEIVDLFSNQTESISIGRRGLYLGKKG